MTEGLEPVWLALAKRLHAIASTGEHFTAHAYDRERYQEVGAIATSMLSMLAGTAIERIPDLFPDYARGYATPKIDVRGAIIEQGRILLVREASDGLWTFPGGYAEVGLSLAANVIKEIREEAGIESTVVRLLGVRHKAAHGYDPDIRDFYKVFFLCEALPGEQPRPGLETTDAAFFTPDDLPPLSSGRTIRKDVLAAIEHHENPGLQAFFD